MKLKKVAGIALAAVMTMAMGMTAFAAPSPQVTGTISSATATTESGVAVTIKVQPLAEADKAEAAKLNNTEEVKKILGDDYSEKMVLADVKEVSAENYDFSNGPIKITFDVTGVKAGDKVVVLHFENGAWVKVPCEVSADGKVTATFSSLSPVAIMVESAGGSTGVNTTSPKTGEGAMVVVLSMVALAAACGAFGLSRKRA